MTRRAWRSAAVALALMAPACAHAAEAPDDEPRLSASVTGSYYAMHDQPDFSMVVAAVNRGPLRFEARYNYEAKYATSAFVGWKFAGGDAVTYEITPLVGALTGSARAGILGLEASVGWKSLDLYIEAEYVRDRNDADGSYVYAWSELGWRPVEWLRVGLAGQRTRVVASDRALQRGVFAQATIGKATIGLYAFNPDSGSRYGIVSLGLSF
jgi:hypothetical protein